MGEAGSGRLMLGAIADDVTGAADLAGMLRDAGARTTLLLGIPETPPPELASDAVVVALKTRSVPAAEARRQSLRALDALRRMGTRQTYFKYCSTFDSTAEGNIGPVTEALLGALDASFTVAVPALPVNGRTQVHGHLFVGGVPLAETHMRHHPVNPMTDSNLVRHLQRQMARPVGLIPFESVRQGVPAVEARVRALEADGVAVALVDALGDEDLHAIAEAVVDRPLLTGGSGLGHALPAVWARRGWIAPHEETDEAGTADGGALVLSGSCSAATLRQLDALRASGIAGVRLDVLELFRDGAAEIDRLGRAAEQAVAEGGVALVYSSATAEERARVRAALGDAGHLPDVVPGRIEGALAAVAERLVGSGTVGTLVVAGGETTGAVAERLGLRALRVGRTLDPGVPALYAGAVGPVGRRLGLAFKSGNFGGDDFFLRALRHFGGRVPTGAST